MQGNLFAGIPADLTEELFTTLSEAQQVKIERIVSHRHASPPDFWYDQKCSEFVLLVQGSAGLRLEGEEELVTLKAGDYLNIGPHVKHRVEWTDPDAETIWLAVHY